VTLSSPVSLVKTLSASPLKPPRRLIQLLSCTSTITSKFIDRHTLSINSNNYLSTVEKGPSYKKTTGMISYVKKWIAAGVPIDGIGAQAHLVANEAGNVAASLKLLCAAAPECALTEVDIVQASSTDYVNTVKACVDIKNCVGVTIWGVRDPDSWRAASNPLLFNSGYSTKPAYGALVQTLGSMTASPKPASSASAAPTSTSVYTTPAATTSVGTTSIVATTSAACKAAVTVTETVYR
jgi:endo-1,4-beta-xylanase